MKLSQQVLILCEETRIGWVINTDAFYQTKKGIWLPDLENGKNHDGLWSEDVANAFIYRSKESAEAEIKKAAQAGKIDQSDYEAVEIELDPRDGYSEANTWGSAVEQQVNQALEKIIQSNQPEMSKVDAAKKLLASKESWYWQTPEGEYLNHVIKGGT